MSSGAFAFPLPAVGSRFEQTAAARTGRADKALKKTTGLKALKKYVGKIKKGVDKKPVL